MSSTMSCRWDRTKNCGDLRVFLFENVVFVKSVAPITQLSYIPCLFLYITLCLGVALDSARCSSHITLQVPVSQRGHSSVTVRNAFFLEIWPPPPRNVEPYTFVTHFFRESWHPTTLRNTWMAPNSPVSDPNQILYPCMRWHWQSDKAP